MIVLLQFRKYGPKAYVDRMKEITDSMMSSSYESTSIYILEAELNSYREMQNGYRYYTYVHVVPAGSQSDASTSVALLSVALLRLFELARYASVSLRQRTT